MTVFGTGVNAGARSAFIVVSHSSIPANARSYETTGMTKNGAFSSTVWIPKKNSVSNARKRSGETCVPRAFRNSSRVAGRSSAAFATELLFVAMMGTTGTTFVMEPRAAQLPERIWLNKLFISNEDKSFKARGNEDSENRRDVLEGTSTVLLRSRMMSAAPKNAAVPKPARSTEANTMLNVRRFRSVVTPNARG